MKSFVGRIFVFTFMVFCLVAYATSSRQCDFPAIINFGDSNSDTGTNSAAFGYGLFKWQTYPVDPLAGRASNGRLIVDYMAQSLDFPHLSPFLDSLGTNFTHGVNFASGGATVRDYQKNSIPFHLTVQQKQFQRFHTKSSEYDKEGVHKLLLPRPKTISRALYTIDIGQNDLNAYPYWSMSKDQLDVNVTDIVEKWTSFIKVLHKNGARSFWIHNTGPYGCLPAVVSWLNENSKVDKIGCSIDQNELAQYLNSKLKEAVVELRKNFPTAAFTYVDIYTAKYTLFSQAKNYGFKDPFVACCGYGGKYNYNGKFNCGNEYKENGKKIFVDKCKDPSIRISWDGVHYTEAANKWVFHHIVNGTFSDPPIPLNMACHRQGY